MIVIITLYECFNTKSDTIFLYVPCVLILGKLNVYLLVLEIQDSVQYLNASVLELSLAIEYTSGILIFKLHFDVQSLIK